jgi:hypothetical protein
MPATFILSSRQALTDRTTSASSQPLVAALLSGHFEHPAQ